MAERRSEPDEVLPRRVFLMAFGCQMNVLDGELVLSRLAKDGWSLAADADDADLVIFNTCSVRQHAEDKVMSRIGQLKRRKERDPGFRIAVMGCMAQRRGEELIKQAPYVDVVCGSQEFPRLPGHLLEAERTGRPVVALERGTVGGQDRDVRVRARLYQAFVAVMRGCHHRCAYCIVPRVRGGREESRPLREVVSEVAALAEDGVREVTLLGQNINSYGRSLGDHAALPELLRAVHPVEGIERIRFVTSNPMDLGLELLSAMAELPKVMEYLHFPAQSGSNRILEKMARGYTRERYLELVKLARTVVPDVELASDFIVGYPGETAAEFRETLDLMERVRFQNCFIFKYSPRPGTRAAALVDDVPDLEKADRNWQLLAAQDRHSLTSNQARIGRTFEVLVEGPSPKDPLKLIGRTRTNQIVVFHGNRSLAGSIVIVRILRATALTLIGEVVADVER